MADAAEDAWSQDDIDNAETAVLQPDHLADRHTWERLFDRLGQPEHPITAERIRQWAKRGRIGRHGADEYGRTLYRLDEIATAASLRHVWLLDVTERCDTLSARDACPHTDPARSERPG